jgi:hypothetical protein
VKESPGKLGEPLQGAVRLLTLKPRPAIVSVKPAGFEEFFSPLPAYLNGRKPPFGPRSSPAGSSSARPGVSIVCEFVVGQLGQQETEGRQEDR